MSYFSYRKSLGKLSRDRDKESKALSKLVQEAKKLGGRAKADEVYQAESFELESIDEDISLLRTRYLINRAEKKSLPLPPMNEEDGFWETGRITGSWYLTNKGITEVRSLIRKDTREILEIFSKWVSILIGLIGAITGLVAVIRR